MRKFLLAAAMSLAATIAMAADVSPMPVKAPPRYASTPCTVTSCTGFFVGGNLANAGGNFDVVGTGLTGLAQNGLGIGGQAGYEFWNGQYYAAILGSIDTDLALNGLNAGPLTTDFKSRLTYGVEAHLGYSLASIFGSATTQTATPTLPQQLLSSLMTPYLIVGEGWRHNQAALISGAGVEALIATNWTIDVDYLHYSYNQGGTAGTLAGAPISQTDDNVIRASISRHFGM